MEDAYSNGDVYFCFVLKHVQSGKKLISDKYVNILWHKTALRSISVGKHFDIFHAMFPPKPDITQPIFLNDCIDYLT